MGKSEDDGDGGGRKRKKEERSDETRTVGEHYPQVLQSVNGSRPRGLVWN